MEVWNITVHMNIIVVIISSIVAILTTGLKTFNYQETWVTYRSTYEKLKPKIHYYDFNIGPYGINGVDKESLFVTRVEALLSEEHTQWPATKKLLENTNKEKSKEGITTESEQDKQNKE